MMEIGPVRMLVGCGLVLMEVVMLPNDQRSVGMGVMTVIMSMRVLVFDRLMGVRVSVNLGEVQVDSESEQSRRRNREDAAAPIAEHPRRGRTNEGAESEDRTRSTRADPALREEVEPEAEAIPRATAQQQGEHREGPRKRLAEEEPQHGSEGSSESRFPTNYLKGIQVGERPRKRVVQSPRQRCDDDGAKSQPDARDPAADEDQATTAGSHQGKRHADSTADGFSVEKPREENREDRLEVQRQRGTRSARVL